MYETENWQRTDCGSNSNILPPEMYDRAPRSLTKPTDSTGQNVGPGSYEAAEHGRTKHGMVSETAEQTMHV